MAEVTGPTPWWAVAGPALAAVAFGLTLALPVGGWAAAAVAVTLMAAVFSGVYHAEVVTSRLGWTTLTADPKAGRVYTHTTAGALLCLDAATGKLVWRRHLSEEFGRFTGYGGRIVSPVFDSGLVMCAIVNSSWGDHARGSGRFVAFDGATGDVTTACGEPLP